MPARPTTGPRDRGARPARITIFGPLQPLPGRPVCASATSTARVPMRVTRFDTTLFTF